MKSTPIYEKRAVLFLDILGFRDLVGARRERDILKALDVSPQIIGKFKESFPSGSDFQMTMFSDSIVCSLPIHVPRNYLPAACLIECAAQVALQMLADGILVRGAISVGALYHRDHTVFGPAMIRAYELESKLAQYPRIIVPPEVYGPTNLSLLGLLGPEWFIAHELFRRDFDGIVHLDILGPHFSVYRPSCLQLKNKKKSFVDLGPVTERLINKLCAKPHDEPRVATKYDWLRSYFVDCCTRFGWRTARRAKMIGSAKLQTQ